GRRYGRVRAELPGPIDLSHVHRRNAHAPAQGLRHDERRGRDPTADTPHEHPLTRLEPRLRDEHPVRRLEDEREGCRLLEAELVGKSVDGRRRQCDQLGVRAVEVLADDADPAVVLESRVDHHPVAGREIPGLVPDRLHDARAVGAEDPRLRHRRETLADPDVQVVERCRAQTDEYVARARLRVGCVLVPEDFGPAVLVDTHGLHGQNPSMTARDLERMASELGLDAVGATPAEPYEETERHIRERRERGLFADMRFTMARPEVSCHPETLLPNARTVISAALCYYADEPPRDPGLGRLPRYTWFDAYAELREKLDALGRRIGGDYRVLVDENDHVDREAAARAGVGFYGK